MTEEQLRTWVALARWNQVKTVATLLQVSPSTVVARMRALEEELGARLVRHGRRLALTPLGESLLDSAQAALHHLDAIRGTVEAARQPEGSPPLRVAASPVAAAYHLPYWLPHWPAARRRNLRVAVCHSPEVVRRVVAGEAEVGFGFDLELAPGTALTEVVGIDPLLVVSPKGWTARQRVERPFIAGSAEQPLWAHLRRILFRSPAVPRRTWVEVEDLEAVRALIAAGMGWGILPLSVVARELEAGNVEVVRDSPWRFPPRQAMVILAPAARSLVDEEVLCRWTEVNRMRVGSSDKYL
jgi:DNA-binding transcriptional LysR family regulator